MREILSFIILTITALILAGMAICALAVAYFFLLLITSIF